MNTWQKWECMAQIKHVVYWCLTWKLTFTSPSRFAEKRRKLAFSQIFSAVKNRNVLFGEMYTKGMDSLCVSDRWLHSGELGNRPQQSDGFLNSLPISQFHWSLFPWACTVHLGRDPFNQNSNRSDREKWTTSKGGPVFSKLFRLDRTDPLSFGPKFPEILVEWIAPLVTVSVRLTEASSFAG